MIRYLLAFVLTPLAALADSSITVSKDLRCVSSDGVPDHATGTFPNAGNPHRISKQRIRFCVDATPDYSGQAREVETIGIAINGIIIRPGTADWYDASSRRKHSRNPASGWRLDGMGAGDALGLDQNNAHVDHRGLYHYHGIADPLANARGSLIGWAADGFEIHYVGDRAQSSYQLQSGTRVTAPGGAHDGTYVQDWTYVAGSGNLDECNGAMLNGTYTYFATDSFPFFPHCLKGATIMQFR
ncbi:YHYH protein [uncultured Tateyamaria sp.]|uniref:YHYH protein n=1 Tax=uncultured Tateyamaria sp. TaxID=455651 RepID=UPI0026258522|nr:YHYH protein [uncultured Tateyamaria sp.]